MVSMAEEGEYARGYQTGTIESPHKDNLDVDVISDGIIGQIRSLNDQLQKTLNVFNELASAIEPILGPEQDGPSSGMIKEKSSISQSEILMTVQDLHTLTRNIQYRISSVRERVQL